MLEYMTRGGGPAIRTLLKLAVRPVSVAWPPPNVWLGVSVEDQAAADERIPLLLQTPAAVRFLSCEPLIGPIDLQRPWPDKLVPGSNVYYPWVVQQLDWVIYGGESGADAKRRPMDHTWARSLRDQCRAAGVPVFGKQDSGPRSHTPLPPDLAIHEYPHVNGSKAD